MSFWNGTTTQIGDNGLFWDNTNKRLGIGTTSPDKPLSIRQPSDNNCIRINHATRATSTYWDIRLFGVNNEGLAFEQNNGTTTVESYVMGRDFHLFSTAGSERMRITSSGNVGIGTTSPSQKLHVDGNIRVTSLETTAGDFVTANSNGVFSRRTAAQALGDIGAAPATGSGNYIQNQTAANQSASFRINGTARIDSDVALFGAGSFGGGTKVLYIANATTVPSSNPSTGGILYVSDGALKFRGGSGTITTIAPA